MLNSKINTGLPGLPWCFSIFIRTGLSEGSRKSKQFFLSFRLCEEIREKWDVAKIIIHHRLGEVEITQPSVIIAISAPHRKESLEVHTKFKGLKSYQELQQQPPPGLSLIDICYCVLSENLSKRPGEISLLNVQPDQYKKTKNYTTYFILII